MTINQQPATYSFVRSPMLYHVSDTNHAETNFKYVLKVYCWTGSSASVPASPTWTLKRVPVSGVAQFDISQLVRGMVPEYKPHGVPECVWVKVEATYESDGPSSPTTDTGNTIAAWNGWNDGMALPNARHGTPVVFADADSDMLLPDMPMRLYAKRDTTTTWEVYTKAGALIASGTSPASSTDSAEQLTYIEAGTDTYGSWWQMLKKRGETDSATIENECAWRENVSAHGDYEVVVKSSGTEVLRKEIATLEKRPETGHIIAFTSRFGVPAYIPISGSTKRSHTAEKTMLNNAYHGTGATDFEDRSGYGQNRVHRAQGSEMWIMNTGFQHENIWQRIKEMMVSEEVYLYANSTWRPVIVEGQHEEKTRLIDKLVNYEIQVKESHDTIGRMSV